MNLLSIIESNLGPGDYRDGRHWWHCPFHADSNPSFCIVPGGSKERWHCFGCREWGDARDFTKRYREISNTLSLSPGPKRKEREIPSPPLSSRPKQDAKVPTCHASPAHRRLASSPSPGWQRQQETCLALYRQRIWTIDKHLLDYLMDERCLTADTIRQARLGANPNIKFGDGLSYTGVCIPWYYRGQLHAVNNRIFHDPKHKYKAERGSCKGIVYPDILLDPTRPVLICEGEFDTLLARQEAGQHVQAITFGSASDMPPIKLRADLALCRFVFFAFDGDEAGRKATRRMRTSLPHGISLSLPCGQDLTDLHRQCRYLTTELEPFIRKHL